VEGAAGLMAPHSPVAGRGRRPDPLESMLRVHLMQNWFALSDPAMEEALYEIASLRAFGRLSLGEPIPDETTILNFRHLLEANDLAEDILNAVNAHLSRKGLPLKRGSIVDATIIAAPSSTKNAEGERDPEMHQTNKGNQHFGMKAHIAMDADSGLAHTVTTAAANEADIEQIADLLQGKEQHVCRATEAHRRALTARICNGTSPLARATSPTARRASQGGGSEARGPQGQRASKGRASVSGHQAPVRAGEGSLPRVGEEHCARDQLFALSNLWIARRRLMAMAVLRPRSA